MNKTTWLGLILLVFLSACQSVPEPVPEPAPDAAPQPEAKAEAKPEPEDRPDPALVQYRKAIKLARAGKAKKAIREFRQLIEMDSEYRNAYTNLGLLLIQTNQMNDAKQALEKAIQQDKSDAIAYNHLAIIQRNAGDFKQALQNYKNAIKADPDYANAYLNLAILLDIYLQDLPAALANYESFQKLSGSKDEAIEKWVIDLRRRIDQSKGKTRG